MKDVPRRLHLLFLAAVVVVAVLSGCSPNNEHDAAAPGSKSAPLMTVPAMDELGNLAYTGIHDEAVTLAEGLWEGAPDEEGAASRPMVALVEDFYLRAAVYPPGRVVAIRVFPARTRAGDSISFDS